MSKPFNRRFFVRDLEATDKTAAIVRFVVSTRRVTAIQRAIGALGREPSTQSREAIHHLVVLLFGATKEAADSFRDCDSQGFLRWTETIKPDAPEHLRRIAAAVTAARFLVDKRDPTSLYSRHLKPVRDSIGMHLNREDIREGLVGIANEDMWACTLDDSGAVADIPLTRRLLQRIGWDDSVPDLDTSSTQLMELITALTNLSHDLFFVLVSRAVDNLGAPAP